MKYLAVKGFKDHQHYRDRNPVWIKLYNALMDDEAFIALSDAARGQLVLIWLLASRRDNKIPNDAKLIARAIQATGRVDLQRLVAAGFLVPYESASNMLAGPEQVASTSLAEPEQDASPRVRPRARVEGETEGKRETDSSSSSPDVARLLDGLPNDTVRLSWRSEIDVARQGMHGPALTDEQIARACRDYVGNGHLESPSLRHFRGFLADSGRPPKPAHATGGESPFLTPEMRQWAADDDARRAREKAANA